MVKGTRIIVESKAEKSNKKKDDKEEDPDDPEPQGKLSIIILIFTVEIHDPLIFKDGKKQREGFGEDHASSDEEELHDDADATETRKRNRRLDEVSIKDIIFFLIKVALLTLKFVVRKKMWVWTKRKLIFLRKLT